MHKKSHSQNFRYSQSQKKLQENKGRKVVIVYDPGTFSQEKCKKSRQQDCKLYLYSSKQETKSKERTVLFSDPNLFFKKRKFKNTRVLERREKRMELICLSSAPNGSEN